MKKLESELYRKDDFPNRSIIGKGLDKVKNYFLKPSTHGGFYFSGIGCVLGGLGGLIREIGIAVYSDSPEIVSKMSRGAWHEAAYALAASATRVFVNTAYISGVAGIIGYVGGTIITGRIVDSLLSIFRFGKKNKEVD